MPEIGGGPEQKLGSARSEQCHFQQRGLNWYNKHLYHSSMISGS